MNNVPIKIGLFFLSHFDLTSFLSQMKIENQKWEIVQIIIIIIVICQNNFCYCNILIKYLTPTFWY